MVVIQIKEEAEDQIKATFDDFWLLYPRRVAKKDARRAWDKIAAHQHPLILTALFEWRRIWDVRGEPEYTPHPATWLNGERWEDDFPPDHRPYTPQQARIDTARAEEQGDRKTMPAHVLEAIRKLRK